MDLLDLLKRPEGNGRLVKFCVQDAHPRWNAPRDIVREFAEPEDLLRPALSTMPEVSLAFVYGSFARRDDVHAESDVDVIVLTDADAKTALRTALAAEALEIGGFLGREVNITARRSDEGEHLSRGRGEVHAPVGVQRASREAAVQGEAAADESPIGLPL